MTTSRVKVLLLGYDPSATEQLKNLLQRVDELRSLTCMQHNAKALDFIKQYQPEVVILDLENYEIKGLDFLFTLKETATELPYIIVFANTCSEQTRHILRYGGASLILPKQTSEESLKQTIRVLQKTLDCFSVPEPEAGVYSDEIQKMIALRLEQIGIPANLVGYQHLISSIQMVVEYKTMLHVTKEIYPKVAVIHHTSPANVERSIRNAIKKTWDTVSPDVLKKHYFHPIHNHQNRPTNKEFILYLAQDVRNLL